MAETRPPQPDIYPEMRAFTRSPEMAGELKFNANVDSGIETVVETALALVEQKFEKSPDREENLDFHNRHHTEVVVARVKQILEAVQKVAPELVSDYDIKLGRLIAANHDTVQNWKEEDGADGRAMRKRFAGENEQVSVEILRQMMTEENQKFGEIFSPQDFAVAQEAILATVPSWDAANKTVIQPNLKETSSIIARALALADIGSAGMNTEEFLRDGDALFREENLDIKFDFQYVDKIRWEKRQANVDRMLAWTKTQIDFARGRKNRLEQELAGLPPVAQEAVRGLFSHFDESIEAATRVYNDRKQRAEEGKLNFVYLAKEMGY